MNKVLLIEDDRSLCEIIASRLHQFGFQAIEIKNFYYLLEELQVLQPDLILLDINLPYVDGYEVCKAIRKQSNVPILMISARKDEMEQIRALELGADDYLPKPFTMNMLIVKVRALLRRTHNLFPAVDQPLAYKELLLQLEQMTLTYQSSIRTLSKNETLLLKVLIEQAEQFVQKDTLIDYVWHDTLAIEENTLSTNIAKLRKLLADLDTSLIIETKRGVGYRLVKQEVSNE